MNIEHLKDNGTDVAVVSSNERLITDTQEFHLKRYTGICTVLLLCF